MVRLVPTGMTWGTPRCGRNEVGSRCSIGMRLVRLVPTVGMTWGTPRSYGRNEVGSLCSYGSNDLGHASFLR